jgi:N utilization substance protein B
MSSPTRSGPAAPAANRRRRAGPSAKARRTAARLAAVQVLYQMDLVGVAPRVALGEFATHRVGQDLDGDRYVEPDMALLNGIVEGVAERLGDIDAMVSASLQGHALERLEMLLRAILRAGTYEILAHADVHPRIAINDYMNVAHGFFGGREPAMVNGVLDHIARNLRPEEMARGEGGRDPGDDGDG